MPTRKFLSACTQTDWRWSVVALLAMLGVGERQTAVADELRVLRTQSELTTASLVGWNAQQDLLFRTIDGEELQPGRETFVRWGSGVEARQESGVVLVDGSLVVGRVTHIDAQGVGLVSDYWDLVFPAGTVRAIVCRAPDLDGLRQRFAERALGYEDADDLLVMVDGDQRSGTLVAGEAGLLSRVGEQLGVRLSLGGRERFVPLGRLRGIVFSPLLTPLVVDGEESHSGNWIGLGDGSLLAGRTVRQQGADVVGEAAAGLRIELDCGVMLGGRSGGITAADITLVSNRRLAGASGGAGGKRAVWLSQQTPLRVQYFPLVGKPLVYSEARFAAFQHRWSWVRDEIYPHTVEMPAGMRAVYRLSGSGEKMLRTELGVRHVDDVGGRSDRVVFRVSAVYREGTVKEVWHREVAIAEGAAAAQEVPGRKRDERTSVEDRFAQIELGPAIAVVLSVERGEGTFSSPLGVWIEPIVTGQ